MSKHLPFVWVSDVDVVFELPKDLIISVCRVLLVDDVTGLEVLGVIAAVEVRVMHLLNDSKRDLEVLFVTLLCTDVLVACGVYLLGTGCEALIFSHLLVHLP